MAAQNAISVGGVVLQTVLGVVAWTEPLGVSIASIHAPDTPAQLRLTASTTATALRIQSPQTSKQMRAGAKTVQPVRGEGHRASRRGDCSIRSPGPAPGQRCEGVMTWRNRTSLTASSSKRRTAEEE